MITRRSLWGMVLGAVAAPVAGRAVLAEGQNPAAVNDAARMTMARVAELSDLQWQLMLEYSPLPRSAREAIKARHFGT